MPNERYSRQSFLGDISEVKISNATVAVVGLGGGGSHIVQQLTHIGFQHFIIVDPDFIDESNLNRLIGGREKDVEQKVLKADIATRTIMGVQSNAQVTAIHEPWQNQAPVLRKADVIFSCVDTFGGRRELEVFSRRYLIPLIDIGMDVFPSIGGEPPRMVGQVILSMPGGSCFWCYRFLSDEKLAREASIYDAAGGKPQVVWPNGILASTAVGTWMSILTDWDRRKDHRVFFSYDGNLNTLTPHKRLNDSSVPSVCPHYSPDTVGDPVFMKFVRK